MSRHQEKGSVLLGVVIILGTIILLGGAMLGMVETNLMDSTFQWEEAQALYLAESGIEDAIWYLANVDSAWPGDSALEHPMNLGTYIITVDHSNPPDIVITSSGYVPNQANATALKTIQVTGTFQ